MMLITSSHQVYERSINAAMRAIKMKLDKGMDNASYTIATSIVLKARRNIYARAYKPGNRLASAITAKRVLRGEQGVFRSDVIVDLSIAPYADWVEVGRNAVIGLPYSLRGGRDYRDSKFEGHQYLGDAVDAHIEGIAEELAKIELISALSNG